MATNKTDRSFKTLINKRTTSEDKRSFEEFGDRTINVHSSEIWADDIADNDPAQAVIDGAAELRTLFTLTKDTTVGGDQTWYAEDTGVRLKDWISDKFGADYTVHIFDDFNNEIFPTHESDWFFDYQTGILTFSGSTASLDKPFRITGYRYIGTKGAGGGGVSGPGSSTNTALVRWNGTAGDALLDSNVTLSASDAMVFPTGGSLSKPGTGSNSEAFGAGTTTSASNTVAVGNGVTINNAPGSVAVGHTLDLANATGSSVVVGVGVSLGANSVNSTVVGYTVVVPSACPGAVGIGSLAYAKARYAVSIGYAARVHGATALENEGAIAIGQGAAIYAVTSGDNKGAIALGWGSAVGNATPGEGCSAAIAIGEDASVTPGATHSVAIGPGATCEELNSVAVGWIADSGAWQLCTNVGAGANSTGNYATSLGHTAKAAALAVAIGQQVDAFGTYSVSIGARSEATESGTVVIGGQAEAKEQDNVCIGNIAKVHNPSTGDSDGAIAVGRSAAIGADAAAGCDAAIAIGQSALVGAGATNSMAIGTLAWANEPSSLAIGISARVNLAGSGDSNGAIALGYATIGSAGGAGCDSAIAIGNSSAVGSGSLQAIAIGSQCQAKASQAVVIGYSASVYNVASGDSNGSIAVGWLARVGSATPGAGCGDAIAIGTATLINPGATDAVCIGASTSIAADATFAVAIGPDADILGGIRGVTIGYGAKSYQSDTFVAGYDAHVWNVASGDSTGAIAIGAGAHVGALAAGAGCEAAIAIGEVATVAPGAADAISIGPASSVGDANHAIALGSSAAVGDGNAAIAIGFSASADDGSTGTSMVAIGNTAKAGSIDTVALGRQASVYTPATGASSDSIAIGRQAQIGAASGVACLGAIALGAQAQVYNVSSGDSSGAIAIGDTARIGNATPGAGCDAAICVGQSAVVNVASADSIAIGAAASVGASSGQSTVVGPSASTTSNLASVFGYNASAEAGNTVAMGASSVAGETQSIAIGRDAKVHNVTTGDSSRAVVIGYGSQVASDAGTGCDAATVVGSSSHAHDGALNATLVGFNVDSFGADTVVIGNGANVRSAGSGDSTGSIAIGAGSDIGTSAGAGCNAAIAIGEGATVNPGSVDAVVLGPASSVTGSDTVAIGSGVTASAGNAIGIGRDVVASNSNVVAIGVNAICAELGSVAIGSNAQVNAATGTAFGCIAIGNSAEVSGGTTIANHGIAIGQQANCRDGADDTIVVGYNSSSYGVDTVCVGKNALIYDVSSGDSTGSIAIGSGTRIGNSTPGAGCNAAIALGEGATIGVGHTDAVAIGVGATSTAADRVTFASTLEVEIGQGLAVWGAVPPGSQPAKISDPTGGITVDSESRTAIQAIIDVLEGAGLSAT